ncbi:sensor histidine kinase [Streptomyces sp. NPDC091292]|uniref:sensor histidine kinase n=1 Tax=Streptomyces sp. NPDC091292 TaxID=3365991 RepID=UPI0038158A00
MSTRWWARVSERWAKVSKRPRAVELTALLLLFGATVGGCFVIGWVTSGSLALWSGILLSAFCCLALFWRNRHPLPVVGFITVLTMVEGALGFLLTPLVMGPLMVALYSLGLRADRAVTRNVSLLAAVCVVATGLFLDPYGHPVLLGVVNPTAWVLLPALLGSYVGVRRAYAADRARQAERTRAEEARHHVVQERMRIARELHDIVAHHLALANAQASTAAHLYHTHPDEAFEMLTTLSATTAEALRELKATVGVLRQDTETGDGLAPAPGLAQLSDLTAACAAAGLDVDVTVSGPPQPLSPGADLAAYRIVQEALTNVTKHASTRRAEVRLTYLPDTLSLTISNEVAPSRAFGAAPGSGADRGFGLIGMRERAQSAGGTLTAGPTPDPTPGRAPGPAAPRPRGFQVTCTLPLHPTT